MLRFLPKLLLVATAFAPVMVTFAIVLWVEGDRNLAYGLLGGAVLAVIRAFQPPGLREDEFAYGHALSVARADEDRMRVL